MEGHSEILERQLMLAEFENKNLKLDLRTARRTNVLLGICVVLSLLAHLYF